MARPGLFDRLPTEARNPRARALDRLGARGVIALLAREEQRSPRAVQEAAPAIARLAEDAAAHIGHGGRLIYVGAGTSGRLGVLDASECPPTFGVPRTLVVGVIAGGDRALRRAVEGAEDDAAAARRALRALAVGADDLVVGIAASGVTPFTRAALAWARARSAATALITCSPGAARRAPVDHLIGLEVGPEVLAGSTRLKAGTATKLALNALSTATMVLLGRCWGDRMVDLVATSAKLRARALRIVREETGLGAAAAARLLARAGGRVKLALAMHFLPAPRRDAEAALRAAGGHLRAVIGPPRRHS